MDFEFFENNDGPEQLSQDNSFATISTKDESKLDFKSVERTGENDAWATQFQTQTQTQTQTQDFDDDDVSLSTKSTTTTEKALKMTDFQTQEEEEEDKDEFTTTTDHINNNRIGNNNPNYEEESREDNNYPGEEGIGNNGDDNNNNDDNEEEEEEEEEDEDEEGRVDFRKLPEHACRYCGVHNPECVVKCVACGRWFCNGRGCSSGAHIIQHLVKAHHKEVMTHPDGSVGDCLIECYNCGARNIFNLGYVPAKSTNAIVILCREPCAASSSGGGGEDWDVSLWRPLIEDRCLVHWLVRPPTEEEELCSLPVTVAHICLLEDAWRSGYTKAFLRDLNGACIAVDNNSDGSEKKKKGGNSKDGGYDDDDETFGSQVAPVTLRYAGAEEYVSVFKPLVRMEELAEKALKEAQKYDGVSVRWGGVPTAREGATASFTYPKYESELRIVPGDELVFRHGKFSARGHVVRIQNEEIVVEFPAGRSFDAQLRDFTQGFSIEFVWKAASYDRMRTALHAFARDETSVSSELYRRILGLDIAQDDAAVQPPVSDEPVKAPGLPALNQSQSYAVETVLRRPLTLIQGPPGTGKTVTSATIVHRLVQRGSSGSSGSGGGKSRRVLVCAPSNVAVDHLTAKIHATGLKVVRLVAKSRETLASPVDFLTLHNQVRALEDPEITTLMGRRENQDELTAKEEERLKTLWQNREHRLLELADVVCCTCTCAGDPRLRSLKFECVLIDESTQATEPVSLIPIVRGARQLVLVGDHCQLGPVVTCKPAALAGLTQSLFERLVLLGVRPVRLQVQYRMHPALSEFPSNTFYEGTLQNGLTVADRTAPQDAFPWPQPSHPLIFYNCPGAREEISSSGTSYINRAEANLCEKIVTQFLKAEVSPRQIGIITPYEGQRAYIVNAMLRSGPLKQQAYADVEVASVDSFQGREKDYIILSCVRSNDHQGIGFLNDPRRLNVAITRARYGIIIIGNSRVLAKTPLWYSLLAHFEAAGCLVEGPLLNLTPCRMEFPKPTKVKFGVAVRYDSVARASAVAQITGSAQPVVDTSVVGYTIPAKNPTVKALRELMPGLTPKQQQQGSGAGSGGNGGQEQGQAQNSSSSSSSSFSNRNRPVSPVSQGGRYRQQQQQQQQQQTFISPFSVSQQSSQLTYEDYALGLDGMSLGLSQASMSSQVSN